MSFPTHRLQSIPVVARLLDGEKIAVVCREFSTSRKTGYKIFNRYMDEGLRGLEDRARSPYRHPNKLPFQVETAILRVKRERLTWGAPKIREKLAKAYPMIRGYPPPVRFTPCWTVMAWSSGVSVDVTRLKGRRSAMPDPRMHSGAPITKASSNWVITDTAIPSRSQTHDHRLQFALSAGLRRVGIHQGSRGVPGV